jgi:hypothetical protein
MLNKLHAKFATAGDAIWAGVAIVVLFSLGPPAAAVSFIDPQLPSSSAQAISDFVKHYIDLSASYGAEQKRGSTQQNIPGMVTNILEIATWSDALAMTLDRVGVGHESPERLGHLAEKIRRPLASLLSTIHTIDPTWKDPPASVDFLKALDQVEKGTFDLVDGRIWELGSGRDMKLDETRKLAFGFHTGAERLIEISKQLIAGMDAY